RAQRHLGADARGEPGVAAALAAAAIGRAIGLQRERLLLRHRGLGACAPRLEPRQPLLDPAQIGPRRQVEALHGGGQRASRSVLDSGEHLLGPYLERTTAAQPASLDVDPQAARLLHPAADATL